MALPKNATAFPFNATFFKNGAIVVSPTLAIGDVKVSINGGAEANITTLPTVKTYGADVTLSAAEMTGGHTKVLFRDPDGTWDDFSVTLEFGTNTVDDNAAQLTTIDDFLDTEIAAIKAKTDNLPPDPADASDLLAQFSATNALIDAVDNFVDTEIASIIATQALIKAKTDNLPLDPADASDLLAQFAATNALIDLIDNFVDTEIAAIKAKTDALPPDPADASDLLALHTSQNALITAVDDFVDTEVAALGVSSAAMLVILKTLSTRLSHHRAEGLDYLDAAISSRLGCEEYSESPAPTAKQNADALLARHYRGGSNTGTTVSDTLVPGVMRYARDPLTNITTFYHSNGTVAFTRTMVDDTTQGLIASSAP